MIKDLATTPRILFWRMRKFVPASRRAQRIKQIIRSSEQLAASDAAALKACASELKWRAETGSPPHELAIEAFALVRAAASRFAGQSHYPVQLEAGLSLMSGGVAEMQTGEGKTLTALLPACLYALYGRGCHVVTANDYLARRDAQFAAQVLSPLGFDIGCVTSDVDRDLRKAEYDRDITYGTSREFGFDFLRDRLASEGHEDNISRNSAAICVQRGLFFALVDEADSVLLDDAATPLLIAHANHDDQPALELLCWFRDLVPMLAADVDYVVNQPRKSVELTTAGCRHIESLPMPEACNALEAEEIFDRATSALVAQLLLTRDRDYIVDQQRQVSIVDSSTGRVAEGRKWRDGLQQSIEVKEGIAPSPITETIASCTVQSYFLRYRHLAGLTGTATPAARELRRIYQLRVEAIPTDQPCQRRELAPRIFRTLESKLRAIADDLATRKGAGGAVLVGTPSVRASDELSRLLTGQGLQHEVLNCRVHEREAEIIAQAGQPGCITIATNMAGRGTDIAVHSDVLNQGGLHVIVTQMHASARIDRQLVGRTARQGEPGSFQMFLSLEDEVLAELSSEKVHRARQRAAGANELPESSLRWFVAAQRRMEGLQQRQRQLLLQSEESRKKTCRQMGLDPLLEAID